jgi:Helix-turn-helix domain
MATVNISEIVDAQLSVSSDLAQKQFDELKKMTDSDSAAIWAAFGEEHEYIQHTVAERLSDVSLVHEDRDYAIIRVGFELDQLLNAFVHHFEADGDREHELKATDSTPYWSAASALTTIMTAAEAAEAFELAEATVRQAINRGQIPARKSAGTWLIRRVDAEKKWKS